MLAELSAQLQTFIQRLRDRNQSHLRNVARDCNFKGLLLQAWNAGLASVAGFNRRLGVLSPYARPEGAYTFEAKHVPQFLWENEYQKHFRPFFSQSTLLDNTSRRVCSAALVRLAGETTWAAACNMLDLPFTSGGINKAMGVLNALQNSHAFALALHDLAARLEALPVKANYQVCRSALDNLTEISMDEWKIFTDQSSFLQEWRQGRRRHIAVWLWARVTGGYWRLAPALRGISVRPGRLTDIFQFWKRTSSTASDLKMRV